MQTYEDIQMKRLKLLELRIPYDSGQQPSLEINLGVYHGLDKTDFKKYKKYSKQNR